MNTQAVFNVIFMIVMLLLIIAGGIFLLVSLFRENWGVLIGALCGAMMIVLIYGLHILGNLKA